MYRVMQLRIVHSHSSDVIVMIIMKAAQFFNKTVPKKNTNTLLDTFVSPCCSSNKNMSKSLLALHYKIMSAILLFVVHSSNVSYMFYNNMSNIRAKITRRLIGNQ